MSGYKYFPARNITLHLKLNSYLTNWMIPVAFCFNKGVPTLLLKFIDQVNPVDTIVE
jgi:hypothetical protein